MQQSAACFGVLPGQFGVAVGMAALVLHRFSTELPLQLRGCAHHQTAGWNVFGDDSTGGHQRPLSHGDAIENDGADSDETAVRQGRTVNHGTMTDRDINPDQHRLTGIAMEHCTILNIAAGSDADLSAIPPGHGLSLIHI